MGEDAAAGGSELRHIERVRPYAPASGEGRTIEKIGVHIEAHVGSDIRVWHELVSDLIHLDIFHVQPSPDRDYHTLVTCRMSDMPMAVPRGHRHLKYAELMLALPADWPLTPEAFGDEANYWPLRLLKQVARMPHEYATWIGYGHTMAFADPPEPFASNTGLAAAVLLYPSLVAEAFRTLSVGWFKTVNFYALIPLHAEEMAFKLEHGAEPLESRLAAAGVTELLDAGRGCVVG